MHKSHGTNAAKRKCACKCKSNASASEQMHHRFFAGFLLSSKALLAEYWPDLDNEAVDARVEPSETIAGDANLNLSKTPFFEN